MRESLFPFVPFPFFLCGGFPDSSTFKHLTQHLPAPPTASNASDPPSPAATRADNFSRIHRPVASPAAMALSTAPGAGAPSDSSSIGNSAGVNTLGTSLSNTTQQSKYAACYRAESTSQAGKEGGQAGKGGGRARKTRR